MRRYIKKFLVAPDWSVNNLVIIDRIKKIMKERDVYQGIKKDKKRD